MQDLLLDFKNIRKQLFFGYSVEDVESKAVLISSEYAKLSASFDNLQKLYSTLSEEMKNKNLSYYKLEQDNKKLKQKIERLEDELASIPEVIVGDVEPNANILMIDSEDNVPETAFSFL